MKRQSGKIKILVVDDIALDGVGWWRNSKPFGALEKLYGQYLEVHQATENVDARILETVDVVVRFRPCSKKSLEFLEVCKEFGTKIILDVDDNLWKIPLGHPLFLDGMAFGDLLHEIYGLADRIWCSTDELRYQIGDLERCEVMQNAILPSDMPERPAKWTASAMWRGHEKQVADLLSRSSYDWFEKNREKYKWTFAGYVPDFPFKGDVRFQAKMQPLAYFLSLKKSETNIVWKPMTENPFNDAKSNIALLEAAMAGGVCVTNYAGKRGWETAFADFPEEAAATAQFYIAREEIEENFNLREVTERRFQSIIELVND